MHLPDINFWLALSFRSHVHHASANAWMKTAGRHSCAMCRVTQMGFLRLATNQKVFSSDALSMLDAWRAYEEILADERVVFAEEPDEIEAPWRRHTQRSTFSTNVWTDAYLAAFAQAAGFELITFDTAFRQYTGLRHTILT
jgi:toxin-antitoxin system PIN domain toxin